MEKVRKPKLVTPIPKTISSVTKTYLRNKTLASEYKGLFFVSKKTVVKPQAGPKAMKLSQLKKQTLDLESGGMPKN